MNRFDIETNVLPICKAACDTPMPFGRFGPASFPPAGLPVADLPYEYLAYFHRNGFPRGRLGELMRFVYSIKRDGAEDIFTPFRKTPQRSLRRPPT